MWHNAIHGKLGKVGWRSCELEDARELVRERKELLAANLHGGMFRQKDRVELLF